jgi:putative transposase
VILPGIAHHVTQRGNRRMNVFFDDDDYQTYKELLARNCREAAVQVWGYCLMPNHVHLILVPERADGLRAALSRTHKRYADRINQRHDWSGHLWQGRFAAVAMDDAHLLAAAKYVELNPVRAGLVGQAEDWHWSSARAHLAGGRDDLVQASPLLEEVGDWAVFLGQGPDNAAEARLRKHEAGGLPLGNDSFIAAAEAAAGRLLRAQQKGRKSRRPQGT